MRFTGDGTSAGWRARQDSVSITFRPMYCPQLGQTTWDGTAALQLGQFINCRGVLAS